MVQMVGYAIIGKSAYFQRMLKVAPGCSDIRDYNCLVVEPLTGGWDKPPEHLHFNSRKKKKYEARGGGAGGGVTESYWSSFCVCQPFHWLLVPITLSLPYWYL